MIKVEFICLFLFFVDYPVEFVHFYYLFFTLNMPKGHKYRYDYVRPISAIRFMCQSQTMPMIEGAVRMHQGRQQVRMWHRDENNLNEIPVWQDCDMWTSYQDPSFVTPPFAGYVVNIFFNIFLFCFCFCEFEVEAILIDSFFNFSKNSLDIQLSLELVLTFSRL